MKIQLTLEIKKTPQQKKKSPAQPKPQPSQSLKNTVIINHK
jgi:hypothetical protein